MSTPQHPASPLKKRMLHPHTVLRVAIDRESGKHITRFTITTTDGEHYFRLLPRMVRQLASRLNSVADRYAVQQKIGGAS